jgi:methylmalonyl-CoA mutase cobalamin-binding domain/chain
MGDAKLQERLFGLILEAKRDEALALLRAAKAESGGIATLKELLEPVLRRIGERWSIDKISLAVAYVAGKVAEDFIAEILPDASPGGGGAGEPAGAGKVAILGNAEDDYHGLGRRIVAAFLRVAGWRVVDLGNDVLPEAFADAAVAERASVIGVSAMMLTNALNIKKLREELDRRGLSGRVGLAVGGAVFVMRPDLVAEVGGDGTVATAMEAPELFERLSAHCRGWAG